MKKFIFTLTGGTKFIVRSKRIGLSMSNMEFYCDLAHHLDFCKVSSTEISGSGAEYVASSVP